ncbi:ABC transporter ATP-binding protein [Streptomyces misionensis]|uniref:ABC transporter ATP-binding protein n=1 Tax=Streptomyces misionensis TaxID=67331 RepID=A0A5C6JSF3_9ACTN|nr:ABC transporter ATP-binding protein [Streptomyces misionensis]TWV43428.1 ABC transporter ATP-binding protein [Streptomyces misionensis]
MTTSTPTAEPGPGAGTPTASLLDVDGLRIAATAGARHSIVDGVSFAVAPGECVGVVGESGSGKSLAVRAVTGLLPDGVTVTGGTVSLGGQDVLGLGPRARGALRGRRVALLMQDPFTMLHPQLTCGRQIADGLREEEHPRRGRAARAARRAEVVRRLAEVGLPAEIADRYPHELSGGMLQRAATAAALAADPDLLIADEPTTALDSANQAAVLALLGRLRHERAMGLVLITHDLRVAFSSCDRIYVLYAGSVLEHGPAGDVQAAPQHPYTAALLASEPSVFRRKDPLPSIPGSVPPPGSRGAGCPFAVRCAHVAAECRTAPLTLAAPPAGAPGADRRRTACARIGALTALPGAAGEDTGDAGPRQAREERTAGAPHAGPRRSDAALVVEGVGRRFGTGADAGHQALSDVSLTVPAGEITALVGRSGSGKTTLARIAIGLETFDSGTVRSGPVELRAGGRPGPADRRRLAAHTQIVFQDPYASLSPLRTVGATLREALAAARRNGLAVDGDRDQAVLALLDQVGLPAHYADRRPAALSGGERQRVAVARALAARPRLLICDEAVAALDVSVQAQILGLLAELRRSQNFAVLFITHDLAVVRQIADRVAVLSRGRVVEEGTTAEVLDHPRHEETRRLLAAVPEREVAD